MNKSGLILNHGNPRSILKQIQFNSLSVHYSCQETKTVQRKYNSNKVDTLRVNFSDHKLCTK